MRMITLKGITWFDWFGEDSRKLSTGPPQHSIVNTFRRCPTYINKSSSTTQIVYHFVPSNQAVNSPTQQPNLSLSMICPYLMQPPLQRWRCALILEKRLSSSRQRPHRNRLWLERKPRSEMGRTGELPSSASGHLCEVSSSGSLKMILSI